MGLGPIVPGVRVLRVEFQCLRTIGNRQVEVPLAQVGHASMSIGQGMIRLLLEDGVEVENSPLIGVLIQVGDSPIDPRLDVLRRVLQHLREIFGGLAVGRHV